MSYKKQELPTLRNYLEITPSFFGGVCVAHHFCLLCCVVFFLLFFFVCLCPTDVLCPIIFIAPLVFSNVYLIQSVLCLVYLMLPVPLDCPFSIAPSVFFNVYLIQSVLCFVAHVSWLPILDCPFDFLYLIYIHVCTLLNIYLHTST